MIIEVYYSSNNFPVTSNYIKGITLSASIEDLYLKGKVIVEDPTSTYPSYIQLGELITIKVREEYTDKIVRSWAMRVYDYTKISDESDALVIKTLEVSLISDWFYQQVKKTASYEGNVSSIITELISTEGFFKVNERKSFIESSTDVASIRYRIDETQDKFITKILKYGVDNKSPLFAYMDFKENFFLKSWNSMKGDKLPYLLTPFKGDDGPDVYADTDSLALLMNGYSFFTQGDNLSTQRNYFFVTEHTPYNPPKTTIIDSIEDESPLVAKKSGDRERKVYQWWVNPQDALSMSIHDSLEKDLKLFQMTAISESLILTDISIGKSVVIAHPQGINKESGSYVIKGLEEIWVNGLFYTKLYLNKV